MKSLQTLLVKRPCQVTAVAVISVLLTVTTTQAQTAPAVEWQASFGGTNSDDLRIVKQTSDGGYILGGRSRSGVSGNKTSAHYGVDDYWVVKVNGIGNKVWENTFGGNSTEWLLSLQQTQDGGYIALGQSESGISGNKTSAHYGDFDSWV